MGRARRKPYRIVGAYDSETTNIYSPIGASAFPILHQLGFVEDLEKVDEDTVEDLVSIELYRHTFELCQRLDEYMETGREYVPVIMCHNLSFDMWPLGQWLASHDVRVLAKSRQKPITFSILDDAGNPRLVIWDTLVFAGQSLDRMGTDAGYRKASGFWDYEKIRTPRTPLTDDELEYARRDIYALICWMAWWIRRNPDIDPAKLGLNVVTKTGVVRERRKWLFDGVKGNGHKLNVGRYWLYQNRREAPKTDDELYTLHACTRGGFTFVGSESASVPFDLRDSDMVVAGFDAVSMHPSHMCAHRYPVRFHEARPKTLTDAFEVVADHSVDEVLERFAKPFPFAFDACFKFTGLRLRRGSVFERDGIASLASARFKVMTFGDDDENEMQVNFRAQIYEKGYHDYTDDGSFLFGKLMEASTVTVWLTELEAWVMGQVYEWESVEAISGYLSTKFDRPTDMSTLSVMRFFKVKNAFKDARKEYISTRTLSRETVKACQDLGVAPIVLNQMMNGELSEPEVDKYYQVYKSDLNALFGIECSNEYRQNTVLDSRWGIVYEGEPGVANAPKNPKTWYQMGQRIVGWSRVAQTICMILAAPHCEHIVNGDTDSLKFLMRRSSMPALERELGRYAQAIDKAKADTLARVRLGYPAHYDALEGIGHYELEFQAETFCAAWNKAYCIADDGYRLTLAGLPASREHGIDDLADALGENRTFGEVCDILLGYNVTFAHSVTGLNARSFPEWGSMFADEVLGERVMEPAALAIYPMAKTVNSTDVQANRANYRKAVSNRPSVNVEDIIVTWRGSKPLIAEVVPHDPIL